MVTARKGVLSIELNLLLQPATFEVVLKETLPDHSSAYYKIILTYQEFIMLEECLTKLSEDQKEKKFTKLMSTSSEVTNALFVKIPQTKFSQSVRVKWGDRYEMHLNASIFDYNLLFIFPDFIKELNTVDFKNRLDYFLDSDLPVYTTYKKCFFNPDDLQLLIQHYVLWHNSLIYNEKKINEFEKEQQEIVVNESAYQQFMLHNKGDITTNAGRLVSILVRLNPKTITK